MTLGMLGARGAWCIKSSSMNLLASCKAVALDRSIETAEMVTKAVRNLERIRIQSTCFDSFAAALCEHEKRFGGEAGIATA